MIEQVPALTALRILVLTLGEDHHKSWWRSQFLSRTGLSYLERIYPRSTFAAAIRSATRAAREVHDTSIGRGTVSHLFRLGPQLESQLSAYLTEQMGELTEKYRSLLMDEGKLLNELDTLTEGFEIEPIIGPIQLSAEPDDLVAAMAAMYLSAFRFDKQVFPYIEEQAETT